MTTSEQNPQHPRQSQQLQQPLQSQRLPRSWPRPPGSPFEGFGLTGSAAIVTGAAVGIGRACAEMLARARCDLVLVDVDHEGLAATADAVRAMGVRALPIVGDVRDPETPARAAAMAAADLGRLDVVVNNAGGWAGRGPASVVETDHDAWRDVVELNLTATFIACQAVARTMIELGRGGSIVNLASLQGLRASAQTAAYGAAKAGVVHLTQTLAVELAPHGIRVNAVAPSFIDTPASRRNVSDERRELSARTIPLGRIGHPDDIAGPALWLASPILAGFVTGQTIAVDGGLSVTVQRPPRT